MLFTGILLLSSWASPVVSASATNPDVLISRVSSTKVQINAATQLSQSLSPINTSTSKAKIMHFALLPSNYLRIDWNSKDSKSNSDKSLDKESNFSQSKKEELCPVAGLKEQSQESQPSKGTITLVPKVVTQASLANPDFFPNKILRSLQHFFRFPSKIDTNFTFVSLPAVIVERGQDNFEVWVNNRLIANLPNQLMAKNLQQRLTKLLKTPNLNGTHLQPGMVDDKPALMVGNRLLFIIEKEISDKVSRSGDLIAIEWVNNLRSALKVPQISLLEAQQAMHGLKPTDTAFSGLASWYGPYFHGRTTANGETFNENDLTVAHRSLPFNTFLRVTNKQNGSSIIVRVNDRGPYIPPRTLDLSKVAARCIGGETSGVVSYDAVIMRPSQPQLTANPTSLAQKNPKSSTNLAVVSEF
jgi:rare lipoprotein A